jgi:hypothetical protein
MIDSLATDWLFIEDQLGRERGAPQQVEQLLQVVQRSNAAVEFSGGVRLMHTAELVLGLGVARVVVDCAEFATERAFAKVLGRLGEAAIAAAWSTEVADRAVDLGATRLLVGPNVRPPMTVPAQLLAKSGRRNGPTPNDVAYEAVILELEDYLGYTQL